LTFLTRFVKKNRGIAAGVEQPKTHFPHVKDIRDRKMPLFSVFSFLPAGIPMEGRKKTAFYYIANLPAVFLTFFSPQNRGTNQSSRYTPHEAGILDDRMIY